VFFPCLCIPISDFLCPFIIANSFLFICEVSNESSTPTSDPYRNSDRIMKSVQLDLEFPSITHLPDYKGSTITETPTWRSVQPASYRAEKHEQQQVVQKHLPKLLHQQQQREEQQPPQLFPTTNASYSPMLESRSVPQNFQTLGITENPLSRCVPLEIMNAFSRSKNFYSETRRSFHSVGTLQRTQ
jgi:hypothetical protein